MPIDRSVFKTTKKDEADVRPPDIPLPLSEFLNHFGKRREVSSLCKLSPEPSSDSRPAASAPPPENLKRFRVSLADVADDTAAAFPALSRKDPKKTAFVLDADRRVLMSEKEERRELLFASDTTSALSAIAQPQDSDPTALRRSALGVTLPEEIARVSSARPLPRISDTPPYHDNAHPQEVPIPVSLSQKPLSESGIEGSSGNAFKTNEISKSPFPANQNKRQTSVSPLNPMTPLNDERSIAIKTNWRWIYGGCLASVAGFLMIAGLLGSNISGKYLPSVELPLPDGIQFPFSNYSDKTEATRKTDKIKGFESGLNIKRIIRKGMPVLIDYKEFIEIKPHVNLLAGLVLRETSRTIDLPPFDPLIFLDDQKVGQSPKLPLPNSALGQGEVMVSLTDFPLNNAVFQDIPETQELPYNPNFTMLAVVPASRMQEQGKDTQHADFLKNIFSSMLGERSREDMEKTTLLQKVFVSSQENVSLPGLEQQGSLKVDTFKKGRSFIAMLKENNITDEEAKAISNAMLPIFPPQKLKPGDTIRIAFSEDTGELRPYPVKLSAFTGKAGSEKHLATVGLLTQEDHQPPRWIALEDMAALTDSAESMSLDQDAISGISLYQSLFETGRLNGIPDSVLKQMVAIHAYKTDFRRPVRAGDSLGLLYVADNDEGGISGSPQVLYSTLTVSGRVHKFYRFRSSEDGKIDYYDETGRSAKMFLIRQPLSISARLSSGFGPRRHPVTHQRKLHTGVDWAAPPGTPIVAAGDGVIEKAEWVSGYGNYTVIRHTNGYKTAYGHQARFAKGIRKGLKVRQGQIIGYVGSTGVSTGPHLHYEVIVNGRFVDPSRLSLPHGRVLRDQELAKFRNERNRIDDIVNGATTPSQFAKLPSESLLE